MLRFALLGHPIRHSASPRMHRAAYAALGLPHAYDALDCPDRAALKTAVASLRRGLLAGLNVTVPYKRDVLDFVDDVDGSAAAVGAANTLVRTVAGRVVAYNTDVPALVDELRALHPKTSAAVILGAGGVAAAAVEACQQLSVRIIAMTTRSWGSSEVLYENPVAEAFREKGVLTVLWPEHDRQQAPSSFSGALRLQWPDLAASADIVLQATSSGGIGGHDGGEAIADLVPWSRLGSHAVALDVVYGPVPTPFVRRAQAAGLTAIGGAGMLARQGARAFELWLGVPAPLDVMLAAVHDEV